MKPRLPVTRADALRTKRMSVRREASTARRPPFDEALARAATSESGNAGRSASWTSWTPRMSSTALYRAFLRASVKLTNYNFRQYARRRARLGFEENRDLQGAQRDEEFQRGCEQLEMLRRCARPRCLPCAPRVHRCLTPKSRGRQAVIGSLYPPSLRSIMEG